MAKTFLQWICHKRWLIVAPFAAVRIQKQWRGNIGRRIVCNVKLSHIKVLQKREKLCTLIQSVW
eukprot:11095192-Ditylum_brightwellii.AAC.1